MKAPIALAVLLFSVAAHAQGPAAPAVKPPSKAEQIDELCKDKVTKAAETIAVLNNPDAIQTKFTAKKPKGKTAVYDVAMSRDDKTKTYTVTAEFSLDNKWCQIMKVQLTSMPL